MQVLQGLDGLRSLPEGAVITIGNYDGVHVGHAAIIARMRELASSAPTAVVTFEPHPLTVLRPQLAPPRLSTAYRKEQLIAAAGVSHLVILPPNEDVLGLTAEEFWHILRDHTKPSHIVEGGTFNFGKDRGGTIERLVDWASSTSIQVHREPSQTRVLTDRSVVDVSSSTIRWLLGYGRVVDASRCLGRTFELTGRVMKGFQRGRTIGVPTANLDCGDHLIPADGVYAGRCQLDRRSYPAAVSIGSTPTFDRARYQVEVHLVGYSGNLYDRSINVELIDWVRDQMKFPNVDALRAQLARDIHRVAQAV